MLIFRNKKDRGRPTSVIRLVVVAADPASGVMPGDVFPLDEGENLIGRDAACEVVIQGPTVSRRHASLRVSHDKGRVALADLGSVNGTLVRPDTRLRNETRVLRSGDEVQIGETILRLAIDGREENPHTMMAEASPDAVPTSATYKLSAPSNTTPAGP